ncbi:MAG TPA: ribosome silencing factor [Geobacterales bacterium]|nr:ribosome silencing factor [Geobacterales bacterium]
MPTAPKLRLDARDRAITSAELALNKKAFDVKVLEIKNLSTIADYLVLASGRTDRQVVAIADNIRQGLKKFGKAIDIEGLSEGTWVVIDYGDVIVHVFTDELRHYYTLDDLWRAAPRLEVAEGVAEKQ